eukprot:9679043-Alexandrium_andersonii.AAC.1
MWHRRRRAPATYWTHRASPSWRRPQTVAPSPGQGGSACELYSWRMCGGAWGEARGHAVVWPHLCGRAGQQ